MRKRLLCDVDGVIADFTGFYLKLVENVSGCVYAREQVRRWSMKDSLGLPDWVEQDVNRLIHEPGSGLKIEAYPEAVEAVRSLSAAYDLYFVTSPFATAPTWVHDREQWLAKHFGRDLAKKVVHTDRKYLIAGDALVDDKPSHVEEWSSAHPAGVAVLWNTPANAESSVTPTIFRTSSWRRLDRHLFEKLD